MQVDDTARSGGRVQTIDVLGNDAADETIDFEKYRAMPGEPLAGTFFVPEGDPPAPPGVTISGKRWE